MNLKKETLEILNENNKSWDDVVAVCGKDFQITKEDFVKHSDIEYDSSFGAPEVAEDLIIVGEGWWLERAEYDGSEWWEYKTFPDYEGLPFKPISALTVRQARMSGHDYVGWKTLATLNEPPETEKGGNEVMCLDCKYLMFSDCYGECSKAYKGIVQPWDSCGKGERKGGAGK